MPVPFWRERLSRPGLPPLAIHAVSNVKKPLKKMCFEVENNARPHDHCCQQR
jgi:hypothetical protein